MRITDPWAVVYCDPPYIGTSGYADAIGSSGFRHEEFYQWCEQQAALVVISEYSMPPDRFFKIASIPHISSNNGKGGTPVTECLFVVKGREGEYRRRMEADTRLPSLFDLDLLI